ncbi:hypothetical protein H5410_021687 [Solanum commersonii]|uniref:Uncharacterized protein n=1 Tax=Solanum commersonii TaxID=4109 RepID=A0A9J5ZHX8_SOLCO|nr:hypothetical protein H5410_021687 [Solanum commersonii]
MRIKLSPSVSAYRELGPRLLRGLLLSLFYLLEFLVPAPPGTETLGNLLQGAQGKALSLTSCNSYFLVGLAILSFLYGEKTEKGCFPAFRPSCIPPYVFCKNKRDGLPANTFSDIPPSKDGFSSLFPSSVLVWGRQVLCLE